MIEGYHFCVKPDAAGPAAPTAQEMLRHLLIPSALNGLIYLWTQRKMALPITFGMEPFQ